MLCTCGTDWLVFPLYFYDRKLKRILLKFLSLSPYLCVCVCVCVCGWVGGCMCVRRQEREREKGRGSRGVIKGQRQRLHEFFHFTIISLPRPLGPHHHHTANSHSTIGQHWGLKVVICQFSNVNLISHLRLTLYFNTKSPVKLQTQA